MTPSQVFIGYDEREVAAYDVAVRSLLGLSASPLHVVALDEHKLASRGLLRRPTDRRGQRWDLPSNAPASTAFAISRFLVPILGQSGWALFVDCDVVFLADVAELFALADKRYAAMVVKHGETLDGPTKMDGQIQTSYSRKNWSSIVLWNCDHPANGRLSLIDVNERPGRDLHQFYWLHDEEIGALPAGWNWLVNVERRMENPKIAHFTRGGPWLPGWRPQPYDELWLGAAASS